MNNATVTVQDSLANVVVTGRKAIVTLADGQVFNFTVGFAYGQFVRANEGIKLDVLDKAYGRVKQAVFDALAEEKAEKVISVSYTAKVNKKDMRLDLVRTTKSLMPGRPDNELVAKLVERVAKRQTETMDTLLTLQSINEAANEEN